MFIHNNKRLVDSMPIIMAKNNRRFFVSVASEFADIITVNAQAKRLHYDKIVEKAIVMVTIIYVKSINQSKR